MTRANVMLNIMPYNCRSCVQGWYGMIHISNEAKKEAIILFELEKTDAEKEPIWTTLETEDPIFVNGFGHGNTWIYTGDSETAVFTTRECDILVGRITYLLSCYTAVELGPKIIELGGIAYGGYDIAWTWMSMDVRKDPYDGWYAEGFYRATNEFPIALIQGETVSGAKDRAIAEYNRWIAIWETERADDPKAASAIKYLIHDRDGLVVLGNLDATIRAEPPETVMLTVNSEPVPVSFKLDEEEHVAPWTQEVSGGSHKLKVSAIVKLDDLFYIFRHWDNGSVQTERPVWLDKDTVLTAIYEQAEAYTLTVNSDPIQNVAFSLNSEMLATPFSRLMEATVYSLALPKRLEQDGQWYLLDHWEDGSTSATRSIVLNQDINLTAYYRAVDTFEVDISCFYGEESFRTIMFIDEAVHNIPAKVLLTEGPHILRPITFIYNKPRMGLGLRFSNWEDGSTEKEREINVTEACSIVAYYKLIAGVLTVNAKGSQGNDLMVDFTFDSETFTTPKTFGCLQFKTYKTVMPSTITVDQTRFDFAEWEDKSTNPERNINFSDTEYMAVTAYYREVGEEPRKGAPSHSEIVPVIVHPKTAEPTVLNLQADKTDYTSGDKISLAGSLLFQSDGSPLEAKTIELYKNSVRITTLTSQPDGSFTHADTADEVTEDTEFSYQAKFLGD